MGRQRQGIPYIGTEKHLLGAHQRTERAKYICQAKTVMGSSLVPSVALLACPSGTVHLIVDFTRLQNDASKS